MRDRFPTPAVGEHGVYPTCFATGTWFASKLTDDDPPRKIPRAPWAYPDHHDRYVGHNNPEVWTDFETAREWTAKLPDFGLANRVPDVEADEQRPVFLDFDDVRDPETDAIHPEVWRFIQAHDLPAWLSSSGTGLHVFALVDELPEGYKEQLVIRLSDVDGWEYDDSDEPELEVYARRHFCALTGEHLEGTPIDSPNLTELVGRMFRERGEKKRGDSPTAEAVKTREEIANVETTSDMQDVLDAIRHTGPRDVRLRSTVTEERADGSKSSIRAGRTPAAGRGSHRSMTAGSTGKATSGSTRCRSSPSRSLLRKSRRSSANRARVDDEPTSIEARPGKRSFGTQRGRGHVRQILGVGE